MRMKQFIKKPIQRCFLLMLCVSLFAALPCRADTGTYRITDYKVKLTPKSDGNVVIQYSQTWFVTGGHIPWITVGTANSAFDIQSSKSGGNVESIRNASQGSWAGVRIDLDRDYRAGESFQVAFTLEQRGLFYAKDATYNMAFTPGWYDRASTDNLQVEVFFYADIDTVSATPKPTTIQDQSMIWKRTNLGPGQRFSLDISFPKAFLPYGVPEVKLKSKYMQMGWLAILFFLAVIFFIVFSVIRNVLHDTYSGGCIYSGGSEEDQGSEDGRPSSFLGKIFSGGGGGFGGGGFSCACACAGCACACACAGGGAAGCDRKLLYRCPLCRECAHKDQCPLWVREAV